MPQRTLKDRVSALEEAVAALIAVTNVNLQKKDWRSTIGMFEGDPVIKEIQEEGRKLREAERRAAQQDAES
jgi:hypothetical protein